MKLGDLLISMCRYDNIKGQYEEKINIKKSPWYIYLLNGNTDLIFKNFEEIRKHSLHPNDYSYPIEDFDKLVLSIKEKGYQLNLCNNPNFQNNFNGSNWKGGKGPVKIGDDNFVWDGHHRCVILLFLYGENYEIKVKNNVLQSIDKL